MDSPYSRMILLTGGEKNFCVIDHLVRYDHNQGEIEPAKKVIEIYLSKDDKGRTVLNYLAYVIPETPNLFVSYPVWGRHSGTEDEAVWVQLNIKKANDSNKK